MASGQCSGGGNWQVTPAGDAGGISLAYCGIAALANVAIRLISFISRSFQLTGRSFEDNITRAAEVYRARLRASLRRRSTRSRSILGGVILIASPPARRADGGSALQSAGRKLVMKSILGIHHITAIAGDPQQNIDFYTGVLGLRLVKITVNFDDPEAYHFYYGDGHGRPGTILTFFSWPGARRGRQGNGQVTAASFAVPKDALLSGATAWPPTASLLKNSRSASASPYFPSPTRTACGSNWWRRRASMRHTSGRAAAFHRNLPFTASMARRCLKRDMSELLRCSPKPWASAC